MLYDMCWIIAFIVGYRKPTLLLKHSWQKKFRKILDAFDNTRWFIFGTLYLFIDMIGFLYEKNNLFEYEVLT
jgi:hypothetical protein